ncbi:aspartate/glutamate racemase family protein [Bradyrhizobium sp. CCBAU 51753]|uniref:aspartate/glutamate racemase family protein n=1 Tax=Bradyrhizobium sp. CCBAU 51753 TaxID=1325100 RepID=UPI00188D655A|nr:aspartate/glutamate racemase family protein [Bradyrhizobium sp. CCBAU 51753]QOZ26451.1 Asp/Glu/hydantoin racemase [Bradyrhizobium sp. CCBAU 51753]
MKILLLNPNTTAAVTDLLHAAGSKVVSAGTELVPVTASRGVPYIATRAEAQIGGAIALEMLAEAGPDIDAAIIAAFGDPGLFGARELFSFPVVGLAEAAMLTACMVGRRFAIVTFAGVLTPWYEECVAMHGLTARCAGVRALDGAFQSISEVQAEKEELLVALAKQAVEQDHADVVILSGAPLAGLAAKVRDRIPVPVIDPVAAAVRQAETLAVLRPRKAVAGTFRRPDPKPTRGLAEPLAAVIEHRSPKQGAR